MPAIARSEPFREQVCPLGVCDGSGWILGPEDVARPCECRAQRLRKGRARGVASAIPARYRGVSFDRPPVADMARDQGRIGKMADPNCEVDALFHQIDHPVFQLQFCRHLAMALEITRGMSPRG